MVEEIGQDGFLISKNSWSASNLNWFYGHISRRWKVPDRPSVKATAKLLTVFNSKERSNPDFRFLPGHKWSQRQDTSGYLAVVDFPPQLLTSFLVKFSSPFFFPSEKL